MLLMLQVVATMQMFVEAFILTNGGAGVNNNTLSVVNLIYQYAFALSGASNYNSASALGVDPHAGPRRVLRRVPVAEPRPRLARGAHVASRSPCRPARRQAAASARRPDPDLAAQLNRPRGKIALPDRPDAGRSWSSPLVFIGPLYFLFSDGLKSTQEAVQVPPTVIPAHLHPHTYVRGLEPGRASRGCCVNTLYYAFGALAFQLRLRRGRGLRALQAAAGRSATLIFAVMLATLMIPATVLVVPQYLTVASLPLLHINLIGSPAAIWLPSVANAFNIFLLKRFFDSIPDELMAAAAIDGAIAAAHPAPDRAADLPADPGRGVDLRAWSRSGRTSCGRCWSRAVTRPAGRPLNVGITQAAATAPQNVIIAASAIAAVPTIVFFLIFQRNIMSGLTAGSLKG